MIQNTQPDSRQLELQLVGSILIDPDTLDSQSDLSASDFAHEDLRILFESMQQLHRDRDPINATTIIEALKSTPRGLELTGGVAGIAAILTEAEQPTSAHYEYYAKGIIKHSRRRELIALLEEKTQQAYDETENVGVLLAATDRDIASLAQRGMEQSRVLDAQQVATETLDALERMWGGDTTGCVPTGLVDLDRQLAGGFYPGELIVIAGRTSSGKSSLAINIAGHAAINHAVATLIVSLEMSAREVGEKLIAWQGFATKDAPSKGRRADIVNAASALSNAPMTIDDTPGRSMADIASLGRSLKRTSGLGLIVVDYVQLVRPDNAKAQRHEQVAEMTRRLKELARELQVPVVCLAQLNRQADAATRPQLCHLRESGSIEQDANKIIFVHRPDDDGTATLIVAKHRNGPTGDVQASWDAALTRFGSLTVRY